MNKPMIRIHNTETDEIVDREMNDSEFAFYSKKLKQWKLEQIEAEAKEIVKAEILDRIGLTADELKTILG